MRLLRHLLGKSSQSKARHVLSPAAYGPLQLDYDPLVAELANQCR